MKTKPKPEELKRSAVKGADFVVNLGTKPKKGKSK